MLSSPSLASLLSASEPLSLRWCSIRAPFSAWEGGPGPPKRGPDCRSCRLGTESSPLPVMSRSARIWPCVNLMSCRTSTTRPACRRARQSAADRRGLSPEMNLITCLWGADRQGLPNDCRSWERCDFRSCTGVFFRGILGCLAAAVFTGWRHRR